eukprot:scaffold293077_cov19-Tisochrysis_lutea.AAC.1
MAYACIDSACSSAMCDASALTKIIQSPSCVHCSILYQGLALSAHLEITLPISHLGVPLTALTQKCHNSTPQRET